MESLRLYLELENFGLRLEVKNCRFRVGAGVGVVRESVESRRGGTRGRWCGVGVRHNGRGEAEHLVREESEAVHQLPLLPKFTALYIKYIYYTPIFNIELLYISKVLKIGYT